VLADGPDAFFLTPDTISPDEAELITTRIRAAVAPGHEAVTGPGGPDLGA
jgi:hypothetical protein